MKQLLKSGLRAAAAATALFAALARPAAADDTDLAFTVEISGDTNVPHFLITNNSPVLEFNRCVITIGNTSYNFDGTTDRPVAPPGGGGVHVGPVSGFR